MKRTAPFTIITKTGREFTEADMERLVSEADLGSDALDLGAGEFLREYKGGFEVGIDGPLVAVWLDDDLDARLVAMADVSGSSAAALMRLALGNYVERPPELRQPQPGADLSGWLLAEAGRCREPVTPGRGPPPLHWQADRDEVWRA